MSAEFPTGFSERLNAKISTDRSLAKKSGKPLFSRLMHGCLSFLGKNSLQSWGIKKKFAYSYTLAIGIAVCGTTGGLAITFLPPKNRVKEPAWVWLFLIKLSKNMGEKYLLVQKSIAAANFRSPYPSIREILEIVREPIVARTR